MDEESTNEESQESEFGKGFLYPLMLFAEHKGGLKHQIELYVQLCESTGKPDLFTEGSAILLWFNGASDHLYDLEIPIQFKDTEIGNRIEAIVEYAFERGHGSLMGTETTTLKDVIAMFDELHEIMMLIDKSMGITPIKGVYE